MKKLIVFFAVIMMFPLYSYADRNGEEQVILHRKKKQTGHNEYYPPADMPEVYYNSNEQEIMIIADGFASYYDVDIVSQSTLQLVLYTTISGYGDSIDVSLLPNDDFTIIITSSNDNVYEGNFTNY